MVYQHPGIPAYRHLNLHRVHPFREASGDYGAVLLEQSGP